MTNNLDDERSGALADFKLITNLFTQMQFAVSNNLRNEAKELLFRLLKSCRTFFWCDHQGKEIMFDTLGGTDRLGMVLLNDPAQVEQEIKRADRTLIALCSEDKTIKLLLDMAGAESYFELTGEEVTEIARLVLTYMVRSKPAPNNWRLLRPTQLTVRRYFQADDPFAVSVELWLLLSHFRDGRLFELRGKALLEPINETAKDERRELDPIVDRFLELGWDMNQIRQEFIAWMQNRFESCRPQFMLAVAGAKCFHYGDKDRSEVLRKYRTKIWEDVKSANGDFMVRMFSDLCDVGMRDHDFGKEDEAFFKNELVGLLSEGRLNQVFQLLVNLGSDMFLGCISGPVTDRIITAKKKINQLIPAAFNAAYASGRCGTAAAFVQQFGAEMFMIGIRAKKSRERIENVARLALQLGQPIRFEDVFCYNILPDLDKR